MKNLFLLVCLSLLFANCGGGSGDNTAERVPGWAKEAVWYQIFPDRFRNGDPSNDPTPIDMEMAWPYRVPAGWQRSPWTADWFKIQPWEAGGDWHKDFDWVKEGEVNFGLVAGLRRYGGDLAGILEKLDYLGELGVTAIYINPLFESPSSHKYDASMYHHIDNNFGPDPQGDRRIWAKEDPGSPSTWKWTAADKLFLQLLEECHKRGIRVIIDGVFNHVGSSFWAFQDVVRNQQRSKYKDWFIVNKWDDPSTPENEFDYQGWFGVRDLPEIREDENGLVSGPREHVYDILLRWMDPDGDGDPSDGVDGWRLDVGDKVHINFWKTFRKWVKSINPEAYITGELWWEDWDRNRMFNAAPWFDGAFDGVMNYRTARAIKRFVADQETQISAEAFVDSLKQQYSDYAWDNVLVNQNLMGSHDVERMTSQIVNPDHAYDHNGKFDSNDKWQVRKPVGVEWDKYRLIAGIQATLPGAPMIYYGEETGMWGGDDPNCRKPMIWPDLSYDTEASHPQGLQRPADKVEFNQDLFDWYQLLIGIRKTHPALMLGNIEFIEIDSNSQSLVFCRHYKNTSVWVAINNQPESLILYLPVDVLQIGPGVKLRDLVGKNSIKIKDEDVRIPLSGYGIAILVSDEG